MFSGFILEKVLKKGILVKISLLVFGGGGMIFCIAKFNDKINLQPDRSRKGTCPVLSSSISCTSGKLATRQEPKRHLSGFIVTEKRGTLILYDIYDKL